jgi:hypothetical protein
METPLRKENFQVHTLKEEFKELAMFYAKQRRDQQQGFGGNNLWTNVTET